MDNYSARLMGSFFIAITTAMPKEAARVASGVLLDVADDPRTRDEDSRVLRAIAESAVLDGVPEETLDRPRLEVITGGAA